MANNNVSSGIENSIKSENDVNGSIWKRSCVDEIVDPVQGIVTGTIPEWLKGSLLQNGPGFYQYGDISFNHVFDGMALLHRYNINNDGVTYQRRFIQSDAYKSIVNNNKVEFDEFGTVKNDRLNISQRFKSFFKTNEKSSDNTSVSIYPYDGDYFALSESPMMHKFDQKSLETLEKIDLSKFTEVMIQTAHPHIAKDGKVYNVGLNANSSGTFYKIFSVPKGETKFENIDVIAEIPATRKYNPSYMHSFGITDNYFIIIEQPLVISLLKTLRLKFTKEAVMTIFKWLPDQPTYIRIINRATGKQDYIFQTDGFCFFHIINQFELDNHLIIDLFFQKDPEVFNALLFKNIKNPQPGSYQTLNFESHAARFVLPLKNPNENDKSTNLVTLPGSTATAHLNDEGFIFCTSEKLCDAFCDSGTINYQNYVGTKYQFFYTNDLTTLQKIFKVDVDNKTKVEWHEENVYPGEGIFVPSPNSQSEDDGVVVTSLLFENAPNDVALLILDGKTFKELGRCIFKDLPGSVPKSFHGWFLNESE